MIPLKLQLKNFLSYGTDVQTIEFGNYPLICLTGKNGHGKSALLDAITWALWGQARKLSGNAKADQGLLRLGQTQMMVCLDFECNTQQYRIKREYMHTYGKPVVQLDFGLYDTATDRFVSLTEKTIRDTQAKIEQTIHISFESFINSAFLRQGQANEFSKKTPKERKEILASILGLDRYELIRKAAHDQMRNITQLKTHTLTIQHKLEQELTTSSLEQQQENLLKKQQDIKAFEQQLEQEKKQVEVHASLIQEKKHQYQLLKFQCTKNEEEQKKLHQNIKSTLSEWRAINKLKFSQQNFSALEQQKKGCLETIQTQQLFLQEYLSQKQILLTVQEQLNKIVAEFNEKKLTQINEKKVAIERLLAEKKHLESSLKNARDAESKTNHELYLFDADLKKLIQEQELLKFSQLIVNEKQFEKRKDYYQRWIAQANLINNELLTLDQKNKLVLNETAPSCPLCEQNLSISRKKFLKNKFNDHYLFLKNRFNRLSTVIKKLKPILLAQHEKIEYFKKQENQYQILHIKIEEVQKNSINQRTKLLDVQSQISKLQELISIIVNTIALEDKSLKELLDNTDELESNEPYRKLLHETKKINQILQHNAYNEADYHLTRNKLHTIEIQLQQHQELQQQVHLQQSRVMQIKNLVEQLKIIKNDLQEQKNQLLSFLDIQQQEKEITEQKNQLEKAYLDLNKKKEIILQEHGSLMHQVKQLELTKQEYQQQQKQISLYDQSMQDFQAIMQATGKDGIQALLIEDAIPEIEQEANELLSALTDNQTQLFIESLKDLKKGGTKETLDIKISDVAGIRPYELFSGGEAFRIDFALRIAISKLLARRAGTSLQTLIIDEGFGSQDEEGLAHIMDALYKIQDNFAKIIIVSHLNSMKNQFPIHFLIEKGMQGSHVQVIEQG